MYWVVERPALRRRPSRGFSECSGYSSLIEDSNWRAFWLHRGETERKKLHRIARDAEHLATINVIRAQKSPTSGIKASRGGKSFELNLEGKESANTSVWSKIFISTDGDRIFVLLMLLCDRGHTLSFDIGRLMDV